MDFQLSLESEGVGSAYPDQPLGGDGRRQRRQRAATSACAAHRRRADLRRLQARRHFHRARCAEADGQRRRFLDAGPRVMSSPPATIAVRRHRGRGDSRDGRGRLPPFADRRSTTTNRPASWPSTASSIIWWTIFRKPCTTCRPIRRPRRAARRSLADAASNACQSVVGRRKRSNNTDSRCQPAVSAAQTLQQS